MFVSILLPFVSGVGVEGVGDEMVMQQRIMGSFTEEVKSFFFKVSNA